MNHFHPPAFIGAFALCATIASLALAQPAPEPLPPADDPIELPPDLPPPPAPPPPQRPELPQKPDTYPDYPPPSDYPPPPAYGPPPVYAPPPPSVPAPREERGVHLHDGFYLRLASGLAAFSSNLDSDDDSAPVGLSLEFGMGGTPVDGLTIGGRIVSSASTGSGDEAATSLAALQLFLDVYPAPTAGFHFLVAAGPAAFSYQLDKPDYRWANQANADGWAASAGVGWEGWVGEQWGIGGMLGLHYGQFEGDVLMSADETVTTGTVEMVAAPTLLFTATFQ